MNIDKKYLLKLIAKLQDGKASTDEIQLLTKFYNYCQKTNDWPSEIPDKNFVLNGILSNVQQKINNPVKERKKIKYLKISKIIRYAAIVTIIVGSGYFFQQEFFTPDSSIIIPDDAITLELDNGTIEIIHANGSTQVVDEEGQIVGTQKGNQLVYDSEIIEETLIYNTISVPFGKRFEIQLSDGTNVHLNAGTSLKYPINFIEGENRRVFLNGEAYFDVAKDENHPFIVNADDLDIRVLGTRFNVSSYPEDEHCNTVLVEGSVSLYNNKGQTYNPSTSTILKPGFKAEWQKTNNQIEIEEVNVKLYTAWIDGEIRFKHMPFKNIIKKLERHYNVVFINHNKEIENRVFTGSFKTETIEQVLLSFNKNYSIEYTIKDNQIIIN